MSLAVALLLKHMPLQALARGEWYAGPGPGKRGNECVTHVDINRGYGFRGPCKKRATPPLILSPAETSPPIMRASLRERARPGGDRV